MKIFAKRKRKAVEPGAAAPSTPRTTFASDPLVEELLKEDPSEWNSKQKRMVKRYQLRKAEAEVESTETVDAETDAMTSQELETKKEESEPKKEGSSSDSSGDDNDNSDDENEIFSQDKNSEPLPIGEEENKDEEESHGILAVGKEEKEENKDEKEDGKVDSSHKIFKLFDQLNSKMKRTLTRKLDREGSKALKEAEEEVNRLLGKSAAANDKKREHEGDKGDKKKKKPKVDLSTLPPEERLRREEQRRMQKEAAERRARGELSTRSHPLNSERRRANRRKPKWNVKKQKVNFVKEETKNHNASGFLARRDAGPSSSFR